MADTDDGRNDGKIEGERGPRSHKADARLAKNAPDAGDLNVETYKSYKRRLDLFELQCSRHGPDCVTEGALLVLISLRGDASDAT